MIFLIDDIVFYEYGNERQEYKITEIGPHGRMCSLENIKTKKRISNVYLSDCEKKQVLTSEKLLVKNSKLSHLSRRSIWMAIKTGSDLYSCRLKETNFPGRPPEPFDNFLGCRYEIIAHDLILSVFPPPGESQAKRPFEGNIEGIEPIEIDEKMWIIESATPLSQFIEENQ